MNSIEFSQKLKDFPLFSTKDLRLILGADFSRTLLNDLKNWEKKGYIIKIKKGLYLLKDFKYAVDSSVVSSKIYEPSYVSMETVLSYYGIIPEAVFTITSVTARKTKNFKNELGTFSFQKIKKEAFGGFETRKKENISYNFALPEKALVDFFYLKRNILNGDKIQFEGYRFNEDFKFNKKRLLDFAESFKNKKLNFIVNQFIKYYVAE
jgi:predicted transcriptional regulator of viral defense system